ncbi:hypothetical protein NE865_02086 [Phthorimaea operculella]|nr:hypothetical protein NE865_02086 [Phthorimaea operculella]
MRSWRLWMCACAAFVAGGALGQTTQLDAISFDARAGNNVTITLSRQPYEESCYVRTPSGETYSLHDADIDGLTAYPTATNFVSCRVVIGPMEAGLLGTWTLCGRRTQEDVVIERCQPGHINWVENWSTTNRANFDHPVNYGFSLSPVVRGSGSVRTCHVITPAGEDIALTATSDYPGLRRASGRDSAACNVTYGPIDAHFIGDWVQYGTYTAKKGGFNVAVQPMTFFLYDEENPYKQAYNVTTLNNETEIVSISGTIIVTVSGSGERDGCEMISNTGERYNETVVASLPSLAFMNNNNAACRLQIGPIAREMFGDWQLIGKFSRRNQFNERRLPFRLVEEDPANPVPDTVVRRIDYLPPQHFDSQLGESHQVTTATAKHLVTESCHIRTPDELQYILREGWAAPGIEAVVGPSISCGVRVHVNDKHAIGEWMLIARIRINKSREPVERRLAFNITAKDGILEGGSIDRRPVTLPTIDHGARIGTNITITLSKQDFTEKCYIQTPEGHVIGLEEAPINGVQVYPTPTNFVSCRVVIGPMEQSLLGTWTLCGERAVDNVTHERCQPAIISWAASDNPTENWHSTSQAQFDHPVNYGFSLSPTVRGTGSIQTCHVITPEGEDIALTNNSDYPGLQRIVYSRDTTTCGVTFGPIDVSFLGSWALYGTFTSHTLGFNVATLPMTFFLYDEENPFNQAYNVTNLQRETHVLAEGLTQTISVSGSGTRQSCEVVSNTGVRYDQASIASLPGVTFVNDNNGVCRLQVGPITNSMFGSWQLIGKFRRNNVFFNEFRLPFRLFEEDPANPIPDEVERSIEYLSTEDTYTSFGNSHTFTTASHQRMSTDSCHLRTPDNLEYILRPGLVRPEFQTVVQSNISCGVRVNVNDENVIGKWMLIARVSVQGSRIERRLPFTIHVEEEVNAVPSVITVAEGSDLYVRLQDATSQYDTCALVGPAKNDADRDQNFLDRCGFIVRDVTLADAGTWGIEYGTRMKYRATINVTVTGRFQSLENLSPMWTKDMPLNETIGPEDTVYCTIEDPSGLIVFQGFGRCRIELDQVTAAHEGVWKATIATAGRVHADVREFVVKLSEATPKAPVSTSVVAEKPWVVLSCKVESEHEVTACKFRDPSGQVLLASQGVGENRYSFHGIAESAKKGNTRECGLRIMNPVTTDLGLWRCAMETPRDTYYGFLTVLCPWAMQDPAVAAAVVTAPTLKAETDSLKAVEGNAVTLRCSVQSAIRYCYFRAQNGTVFNVSPGSSDWFSYAGAALDAGECSIRFPGLQAADSGRWSCHVGFLEHARPEQTATIHLHVDALMVTEQMLEKPDTLVVRGQVHSRRSLEYCRFVRIDGKGFTSDEAPAGYEDRTVLANGKCEIRIRRPGILEQHPWTVVAKIAGAHSEIARSTLHTLTTPEEEAPVIEVDYYDYRGNVILIWSCVLAMSLLLLTLGVLLGPKRHREWTFHRAASLRDSLRRRTSLAKPPLPVQGNGLPDQNTPIAA